MCRSKADGGRRCHYHAKERFNASLAGGDGVEFLNAFGELSSTAGELGGAMRSVRAMEQLVSSGVISQAELRQRLRTLRIMKALATQPSRFFTLSPPHPVVVELVVSHFDALVRARALEKFDGFSREQLLRLSVDADPLVRNRALSRLRA